MAAKQTPPTVTIQISWKTILAIVGIMLGAWVVYMIGDFLILLFAGGSFWSLFPLRGLMSDNWADLTFLEKLGDYFWHLTLPVLAMVIGGFAKLTLLTKNSFMEELNKQYVVTARAKGLSNLRVIWVHAFRNAVIPVVTMGGILFITVAITGAILTETIFGWPGIGSYIVSSVYARDYPVIQGSILLIGVFVVIINALIEQLYRLANPRMRT